MKDLEKLVQFAESPVWGFLGRNCSSVDHCIINEMKDSVAVQDDMPIADESVVAHMLFEHMELGLEELSQIFVQRPVEYYSFAKGVRPVQPTAGSYDALGGLLMSSDDGWSAFARLVGKTIKLYNRHDGDDPYSLVKLFLPNGERIYPATEAELEDRLRVSAPFHKR